jgi:DNA polymerase III epsilon subunit-like protein
MSKSKAKKSSSRKDVLPARGKTSGKPSIAETSKTSKPSSKKAKSLKTPSPKEEKKSKSSGKNFATGRTVESLPAQSTPRKERKGTDLIVFAFDTETTGLVENRTVKLDKQPEIIEFYGALVNLDTGKVLKEIDQLFKPSREISEEITKITGIDNDMVANSPPFKQFADVIKTLLQNAPAVLAHNLSFDIDMVELEMERLGKKVEWPHKICTVEQTKHLKGFRLKLSLLHEHLFGTPFSGAHRAKVDVEALIRCAVKLRAEGVL